MGALLAGRLRERLVISENVWPAVSVTSLTRVGTTATAMTNVPHNYASGDYVPIAGATPSGYTGRVKITVTGATTFTYPVDGSLATPATGTITATFASDAQGGRRDHWTTKTTLRAELVPIGATERLQLQAIASTSALRFRVRRRPDLQPAMRASWTPVWPPTSPTKVLEIHGVLPDPQNPTMAQLLDCGGLD